MYDGIFLPFIFKSIFMEVEVAKPYGVQRSKEEIISILEECRKSNLNVKEFVKTKGIHEATYYNWRNKYGGKQKKQKAESGFATLKINPSPATHAATLFAEVRGIKIYHYVPSSYLKELIG
jgi:hypothetical protein